MLFCCCPSILRPYSFAVLIITLIFHIFEIVELGINSERQKWILVLLICHIMVACSTLASFKGVIAKDVQPLMTYLVFAIFGFFPIITDLILLLFNKEKIFSFDTTFIEKKYATQDAELIIALILVLILAIKCDFTAAIYEYVDELRRTDTASTEYTHL